MINIYVSKFAIKENGRCESISIAVGIFASESEELAEKEAIYKMSKAYPSASITLVGTTQVGDDLIDLAYESRH
jgi:hypothetical protein